MLRFREKLYDIARQITREDSAGRELADSVYTDLYGTKTREGERVSKLSSYRGRGSLEGWLRTVLAQEYVNTYRRQRRLVSLDEESEEGAQFSAAASEPVTVAEPRLEAAIDDVLRALSPEDSRTLPRRSISCEPTATRDTTATSTAAMNHASSSRLLTALSP